MLFSCIHTHTRFCDGEDDVESFCEAAWKKGFVSLGFSSHAPITRKTGMKTDWHLKDEALDEYIETVRAAGKRWEGKLAVYLGLEVDYVEGFCGPADSDFQSLPLDFIIGSVHCVFSPKTGEPFVVDSSPEEFNRGFREIFNGDGEALFNAYYDANCRCIRRGGFDILAHPDLIKKNNGDGAVFSPEDPSYIARLEETAGELAAARISADRRPVAEINTGGMIRKRISEPYPSPVMLGFFKERNIPLVINADAHAVDHLGGYYEEARQAMLKAGYDSALLFEGRKDGKALWREDPL
jgi:histidinol-phosphatase (PHP family)